MRDYKTLKVWEKAHALTLSVYDITKSFPKEETFGLKSQIRRAAYSIPSNIAEGCGRESVLELAQFCRIAMGSASELEYELLLSRDLGYLNEDKEFERLFSETGEIKRMLRSFVEKLKG